MKHFFVVCVVTLVCFHQVLAAVREYAPVVETKKGKIVGIVREVEDEKVHVYEGIRYGRAERFSKPKMVEPWNGTYNATTYQFACPQPAYHLSTKVDLSRGFETGSSSEDCLFLNVFKPATEKKNRPVMVWIHGGSFEFGTIFSVIYDGRVIASLGDVIVVTVNYRLGALGFLYGGTADAPGNAGLYDQILALQWVHENIESFGGDPNQVTIFGESAGSMSVSALTISPLTKGLFKRAIMQSGAANSYLGSEEKKVSLPKMEALGEKLHCNGTQAIEILKCLRAVSVKKILHESKGSIANGESFVPVWGEEVMPIRPVEALKTGKVNQVDLMFGVTRNEGSSFVSKIMPMLNPDTPGTNLHIAQVKSMIKLMFMMFKEPNYMEVVDFYTKNLNESDKNQLRKAVSDAFGDYHLVCPTILYGEQFSKVTSKNKHYSFRVSLPSSIHVLGCSGNNVCHGTDVVYMFGIPIRMRGLIFSEAEYHLSYDMITAWTNFAKTGNPGKVGTVQWTEALGSNGTATTVDHLNLDSTDYRMVPGFYKEVCDAFWAPKIFA